MAGTSNLTWITVNSFMSKIVSVPFDSKPNTVACSIFEFPFDCKKDTAKAMRLT